MECVMTWIMFLFTRLDSVWWMLVLDQMNVACGDSFKQYRSIHRTDILWERSLVSHSTHVHVVALLRMLALIILKSPFIHKDAKTVSPLNKRVGCRWWCSANPSGVGVSFHLHHTATDRVTARWDRKLYKKMRRDQLGRQLKFSSRSGRSKVTIFFSFLRPC